MKKLLLICLAFVSCEKSECYLCEKGSERYRYCDDVYYSPTIEFEDQIDIMREDGFTCDYYVD